MDEEEIQEPHKLNTKIIVLVAVIAVAIALLGIWFVSNSQSSEDIKTTKPVGDSSSRQPDPVNSNNGSEGDTSPSSSGTGPGSSNSIIGQ